MALRVVVCVLLLAQLYCAFGQVATPAGLLFNLTKSIQSFTLLPNQTIYNFTVVGAAGGGAVVNNYWWGGRPGFVTGSFDTAGLNITNVSVLVGARGATSYFYNAGGGGGGSFIFNPLNLAVPIVAAGGAGGSCNGYSTAGLGSAATFDASTTAGTSSGGYSTACGCNANTATGGASGSEYYVASYGVMNCSAKGWNEIRSDPSPKNFAPNGYYDAPGGYGGGGNGVHVMSGAGGGYSGGSTPYHPSGSGVGGGGASYVSPNVRSSTIALSPNSDKDGYVIIFTTCPNTNGIIAYGQDLCICKSGFYGPICNTTAPPECGAGFISNTTQSNPYPNITSSAYTQNTLNFVVSSVYTPNRRFNQVYFTNSASNLKCNMWYGAKGYILQSFSGCQDRFTISMPWVNHTQCGFVQTSIDDNQVTWKGTLAMEYEEFFTNYAGFSRIERQSYDVYVQFPRKLTVTTYNITLFSVVPLEYSFVGEWYDAVNKELTLEIDTVVGGTSKVTSDVPMTITTPANVIVSAQTVFNDTRCVDVADTLCLQRIQFKLKLVNESVCTFNGMYAMNSTITACRTGSCFPTKFTLSFGINSGSVCTRVDLTPPISGFLQVYSSLDFSIAPSSFFSLNEDAYFKVNVDAGVGNVVALTFIDITYELSNGIGGVKYLLNATKISNDGSATGLKIFNENKYFYMNFQRSVFGTIPLNSGWLYTFTANCAVVFQGNKKRDVRAVWEMAETRKVTQTRVNILNSDDDEAVPTPERESQTPVHAAQQTEQLSVAAVAAIALCAAIVALVVGIAGVAYYFKRTYSTTPAEYAPVDN